MLKPGFGALNHRGQAVVEYVLLLVVIISMIIASKGLFDGANKFINAYIGDYFVCLMDHGELPAQGVSDSDLKKHQSQSTKCKATFSITNGATLTGGGGGSSSTSGGGSSSTSNKGSRTSSDVSKDSAAEDNSKSASNKSKNKSASRDLGGSGSDGRTSPYDDGRISKSNSGRGTADGPNDLSNKTKIIDEDQAEASGFGRGFESRSKNQSVYRRERYRAVTGGQMFDEIEKNSKPEARQPISKSIAKAASDEGYRPGPRKNAFIPPERKVAAASEDIEPELGFAGMLKWLMIAGMVIAIIVFFGGQIMNYSNSE